MTDVPDWAIEEPPVDPVEQLFREILITSGFRGPCYFDLDDDDRKAIEVLRRGIELARTKSEPGE